MNLDLLKSSDEIAKKAMDTPVQHRIDNMQKFMLSKKQIECPLEHEFTNQFYIRTMSAPANTIILSKIHKEDSAFFLVSGEIIVWDETNGTKVVKAPFWGITKAPQRRIGLTITDIIWVTFHRTNHKTVEEVEQQVIYNPNTKGELTI